MNTKTSFKIYTSAIFCALIMHSCAYDENECVVVDVSYSNDIVPLLDEKCGSCHGASYPEADLNLTDYEVVSQTANNSKIIHRINLDLADDQLMPPNSPLTDCQIDLFTNWVEQGALNN